MKLGELPSNFRTYICEHVLRAEREVGYVAFETDGGLIMTCGARHEFTADNVKVLGVGHLLQRHFELKNIDLRPGFEAEKTEAGEWRSQAIAPETNA